MPKFSCQCCGRLYSSTVARNTSHCSNSCRAAATTARNTKICSVCAITFVSKENKFCSPSCAKAAQVAGNRLSPEPAPVDGCRWIPLTNGEFTLVDEADYATLTGVSWRRTGKYATAIIDGQQIKMHQLLVGRWHDHISRDPMDNRRSNLRPATAGQNAYNRTKRNDNTSGFVGVMKTADPNRPWTAHITVDKRRYYLGSFRTALEAAEARDAVAVKPHAHGEFARLTSIHDRDEPKRG